MEEQEKKSGFMDKVKAFFAKLGSGAKDVAKQTARRNSGKFLGNVLDIGNINIESDHALIYAINMEDIVFKRENVVGIECSGELSRALKIGKATYPTVKYDLRLDDKVVYPEKLKTDTSVLHMEILINKDATHYFGEGTYIDPKKNIFEGAVYVFDNTTVITWKRITDAEKGMCSYEPIILPHAQLTAASCKDVASFTYATGGVLTFTTKRADDLLKNEEISSKA